MKQITVGLSSSEPKLVYVTNISVSMGGYIFLIRTLHLPDLDFTPS